MSREKHFISILRTNCCRQYETYAILLRVPRLFQILTFIAAKKQIDCEE